MNDSPYACRHTVENAGGLEHLDVVGLNRRLRRHLHDRGGYRQPLDLVLDRLVA